MPVQEFLMCYSWLYFQRECMQFLIEYVKKTPISIIYNSSLYDTLQVGILSFKKEDGRHNRLMKIGLGPQWDVVDAYYFSES